MRRRDFIIGSAAVGTGLFLVPAVVSALVPDSYTCDCGLVTYVRQPEGHYAATHFAGQRFTYALHRQHMHIHRRSDLNNLHRDFAPCDACGVETWGFHRDGCPKGAIPVGEEKFYESLQPRLIKIRKRGHTIKRLTVESECQGFRLVRVWVQGEETPYTWYHPA